MSERKLLFLMNAEQAEAFVRLVEAAEAGDGGAACRLGDMCREGLGGLRFSPQQAHRWYARSALAGDANGQNNVGACYERGLGCKQSYVEAVKWYRLSAAQELGTASMNLGYCYLRGHGVPPDKEEALRLFRLGVEQGEPKAADELERLGEPVNEGKVTAHRGVRFVDATQDGVHLGLVGVVDGGAPGPGQDERIRRQLEQVLKVQTAAEEQHAATDDELFPIYAESEMKPDDFVEETARILARSLDEEVDAWFDDSSRSDPTANAPPRFVLVYGAPVRCNKRFSTFLASSSGCWT